jgi:hypothetical protein
LSPITWHRNDKHQVKPHKTIGELLDAPDAELRVSLVGSQLVGLGIARHVLGIEPLASASTDQLVAAVAPNLQRYLTGPL